jgi:hypothetical protein
MGEIATNRFSWTANIAIVGSTMNQAMMILIAGPYRSGTEDDPTRMSANLRALEAVALPLFRAGHLPMIGEWVALPLLAVAGAERVGDALWEEILYPTAHRLLSRCDAVLRLPGASKGADNDVRLARERGLPVYFRLEEVPGCAGGRV